MNKLFAATCNFEHQVKEDDNVSQLNFNLIISSNIFWVEIIKITLLQDSSEF